MNDNKLIYYLSRFSKSAQVVTFKKTGHYYHDRYGRLVDLIYVCPLCLKNRIAILNGYLRQDKEFTHDHYPPESAGGSEKIMVCKDCNNNAGIEYDYSIKEWLQAMSFDKGILDSELPVKIKFEDTKGLYKGLLRRQKDQSISFDDFNKYPFPKKWFNEVIDGKIARQTITFHPPKILHVQKAILKAAYLYCFSIWGYDFTCSDIGEKMRNILNNSQPHMLSNYGIFFHMDSYAPPCGLTYIYKPVELQSFMVSFELSYKRTGYKCSVSVLIPGPEEWQNLKAFQSLIESTDDFFNHFIKLPENNLFDDDLFPFSNTWKNRFDFKILGENVFNH